MSAESRSITRAAVRLLLGLGAVLATGCAGGTAVLGTVTPPGGRTSSLHEAVVYAVPAGDAAPPGRVTHRLVAWTRTGFSPRVLEIQENTEVTFRNDDTVYHNAFSPSPTHPFDVGRFGPGETRSVLFDRPGVFDVFCELHPEFSGTIVVVPRTGVVHPDAAGHYRLRLAPGDYVVTVWHPDFGQRSRTVRVPPSGEVDLALAF